MDCMDWQSSDPVPKVRIRALRCLTRAAEMGRPRQFKRQIPVIHGWFDSTERRGSGLGFTTGLVKPPLVYPVVGAVVIGAVPAE